jgi:ribonuclease VapC
LPAEVVFDASAVLAILKREPGAERALAVLDRARISCVNLAEAQSKLVHEGLDKGAAWARINFLGCSAVPFDSDLAYEAGSLIERTKPLGLSLGDRACLSLALARKAKVYTTDRAWAKLKLGIEIEVIR